MTGWKRSLVILGVIGFAVSMLAGGCTDREEPTVKVVTTTSLISQIVERVGGNTIEVANIIPPAQCPGHFDVKPGDVAMLAEGDLFFKHGWQGEMFSDDLIASADNPDLEVVTLNIQGNWMTPAVQQEAVDIITDALQQLNTDYSKVYAGMATKYEDAIAAKDVEVRAVLDDYDLAAVNVMCSEQQAGFVNWVGLNVVATYGRPEDITIQMYMDLVDTGRANDVSLIIDNLQSGADAGKELAEELGVTRIILSNFPGGFEGCETWEDSLDQNIKLIIDAVSP